ncbi:MAG: DNA repair protein RecO [Candidatus Acidiferrales bacterium]|jgi:DNA repair protein RecO (recombination protein O)
MPIVETEAVILRSFPLSEGDRIVSFLSRSAGRVKGVARGASKPKSRFGASLETLSHVRICFYERETRDLVRIQQCELIESFMDVQSDYAKGVALALLSEVTEAVLGEHEPAEAQFRLLLLAAHGVRESAARGNEDASLPLAYFAVWTVRLGGWLPSLERCTTCGAPLEGGAAYLDLVLGGLACGNCQAPGAREISAAGMEFVRRALRVNLTQLAETYCGGAVERQVASAMLDLIESHVERNLTTRRFLDREHREYEVVGKI